MKKRILIGSCGGLTGNYLTRQFQKLGYYVIGADASERNATRFFVDEFVKLPPAKDENFMNLLVDALKEHEADYYIPVHSKEFRVIAKNEQWLRDHWDGKFIITPQKTFELLENKKVGSVHMEQVGIPVPKMYDDISQITEYPVFMKPDTGSASQGTRKIENRKLAEVYAELEPGSTFYELVKGTEFTVDCMFDDQGKLLGYNQRIREKSLGGGVIVSRNDYQFDILPYLKKLEENFVFKGCVNFQYILRDGVPYFIDVNLRYASGGLPLAVASGINIPQIMLDIFEGNPIGEIKSCAAEGKTMYRYFEELYEG